MELLSDLWDMAVLVGKCTLIGVTLIPGVVITFWHLQLLWYQHRNGLLKADGNNNNPIMQVLAGAEMIIWMFGYACLLISALLYFVLF